MTQEKEPQVSNTRQVAGKTVAEKYADVTLRLVEDHGDNFGPLTPEKEKKLRRKLYLHIMVLVSAINFMLFVSEQTCASNAYVILAHLSLGGQVYPGLRLHLGPLQGDGHLERTVQ